MTTQMKALDEYFLIAVFTLLLNRVHVFAIWTEELHGNEMVKTLYVTLCEIVVLPLLFALKL